MRSASCSQPNAESFGDLLERRTKEFELKLAELTGAVDILRGAQPPPPAQFPSVKAFSADTIYHEGDIVAFAGGTYQAAKDTARAPGAQDWICLAAGGCDGKTIDRGARSKRPQNIAVLASSGRCDNDATGAKSRKRSKHGDAHRALNGGSFIALKDAPGPCRVPVGNCWRARASTAHPITTLMKCPASAGHFTLTGIAMWSWRASHAVYGAAARSKRHLGRPGAFCSVVVHCCPPLIVLRTRTVDGRPWGAGGGQMEKLSSVGKFHSEPPSRFTSLDRRARGASLAQ